MQEIGKSRKSYKIKNRKKYKIRKIRKLEIVGNQKQVLQKNIGCRKKQENRKGDLKK